jgi:hypothetical protein
MRSLLEKGYSNLNLLLYKARGAEELGATGLSSDIAQTHFKKGVEFLGTILVCTAQKVPLGEMSHGF